MAWTELKQIGGIQFRTLPPGRWKRCGGCGKRVTVWPCVKCAAD